MMKVGIIAYSINQAYPATSVMSEYLRQKGIVLAAHAKMLEDNQVRIVKGADGLDYELRKAVQADISAPHYDRAILTWNNGWKRHAPGGKWEGWMIRPADPAVRSAQLKEHMANAQIKLINN